MGEVSNLQESEHQRKQKQQIRRNQWFIWRIVYWKHEMVDVPEVDVLSS